MEGPRVAIQQVAKIGRDPPGGSHALLEQRMRAGRAVLALYLAPLDLVP